MMGTKARIFTPIVVKMGAWPERIRRMDLIDCTRISHALAKKLAPSCTTGRFPERMSHVASTGALVLMRDPRQCGATTVYPVAASLIMMALTVRTPCSTYS